MHSDAVSRTCGRPGPKPPRVLHPLSGGVPGPTAVSWGPHQRNRGAHTMVVKGSGT
ncbi:hypothetical protein GCM10010446_22600 [Streptomyces enissocaesilis]|uniref:Uncharacterized protein n=1 Tax=Streptomyces enissocaesilis TaxID=332589 RepID=A0ABN3X698_9ACTN